MNLKQLSILLALVVVLGGGGLYIYKSQNEARRGGNPTIGKKLLPEFPVNDVAGILIKQGTNELTLSKSEDLWRVQQRDGYPANYQEISDFLLKARDLKAVQTEKVGPSQLPRLQLVPGEGSNSPTVVELKDKSGKVMHSLLLGKKHMRKSNRPSPMGDMGDEGYPDGRYVKVGATSDTVAIISDPLSNIEPRPEQWLAKDFFKVEKVRSIAVAFPQATNSWQLTRETESGEWKLADPKPGEQLDSGKTSGVTSSLSSPSFTDVAPAAKAQELGVVNPTAINIETFDNLSYSLKAGQKTNDTYPVLVELSAKLPSERPPGKDEKPEDKEKLDKEFKEKQKTLTEKVENEKSLAKWVYLVSSWTLDSLLKERSQLMAEKKEEPKKDESTTNAPALPFAPALPGATEQDEHNHADTNSVPGK